MLKILGLVVGTEKEMAAEVSSKVASLAREQAWDYMVDLEAANTRAQGFKEEARKWKHKASTLEEATEELHSTQQDLWAAVGLARIELQNGNARQALNALKSPYKKSR